jgi:putative spermidine/putrescine transport system substrate-binding protein
MMPNMPTAPANTANSILMNPDYWADNEVEIGEKWEAFKSSL